MTILHTAREALAHYPEGSTPWLLAQYAVRMAGCRATGLNTKKARELFEQDRRWLQDEPGGVVLHAGSRDRFLKYLNALSAAVPAGEATAEESE